MMIVAVNWGFYDIIQCMMSRTESESLGAARLEYERNGGEYGEETARQDEVDDVDSTAG